MDSLIWWGDIKDDLIFGSFLRNFDLILKLKISKSTNLINHFVADSFDKIIKQSYFNFELISAFNVYFLFQNSKQSAY